MMYSGIYCFAGVPVRIDSLYPDVQTLCRGYETALAPQYRIVTAAEDIAHEREASARADLAEGREVREYPEGYLETLAVYRKAADFLLHDGILLFHGSAIAVDGVGYLFTAKSGTGKSTHTRLWRERFGDRAVMVNDDKPLLKITENGITVYGTPWNGKHRLSTNCGVPLKALCILTRDSTNHIERISARSAYPMVLQQAYRPRSVEGMETTLKLAELLMKGVGLYRLGCNMEPEAAAISYEGMQD